MRIALPLALSACLLASSGPAAAAADRHEGYYYAPPAVVEDYVARAPQLEGNDRLRRLNFVGGIIREIADRPYPPTYAIFAKGTEAEKLIIVGVRDGFYDTLYRTRALLAALTALSRATPLFQDLDPEQNYTFFDLCFMLGFEQLTISDGRDFSHQIRFKAQSVTGPASK